jgi:transcriptional pleiotropic regulator of transition state genes
MVEERKEVVRAVGVVRRVDSLGRVMLPAELRRTLKIKEKEPMMMIVDEGQIILKKINLFSEFKEQMKLILGGG